MPGTLCAFLPLVACIAQGLPTFVLPCAKTRALLHAVLRGVILRAGGGGEHLNPDVVGIADTFVFECQIDGPRSLGRDAAVAGSQEEACYVAGERSGLVILQKL